MTIIPSLLTIVYDMVKIIKPGHYLLKKNLYKTDLGGLGMSNGGHQKHQ